VVESAGVARIDQQHRVKVRPARAEGVITRHRGCEDVPDVGPRRAQGRLQRTVRGRGDVAEWGLAQTDRGGGEAVVVGRRRGTIVDRENTGATRRAGVRADADQVRLIRHGAETHFGLQALAGIVGARQDAAVAATGDHRKLGVNGRLPAGADRHVPRDGRGPAEPDVVLHVRLPEEVARFARRAVGVRGAGVVVELAEALDLRRAEAVVVRRAADLRGDGEGAEATGKGRGGANADQVLLTFHRRERSLRLARAEAAPGITAGHQRRGRALAAGVHGQARVYVRLPAGRHRRG